jgi:sugar lactone lactonase YvrE
VKRLLLSILAAAVGCNAPPPQSAPPDQATVADLSVGDVHDLGVAVPSDMAMADLQVPDLATPDLHVATPLPDLALPDLLQPDLLKPDLALPDLMPPADLAQPPMPDLLKIDLAPPPDLMTPADLTTPPDLAPTQVVTPVVTQIPGVSVDTLAGSSQVGGMDGTGASAQFDNPVGLALDPHGLLYVTEYDGGRIRTVDSSGKSGTLTTSGGSNTFRSPFGIAFVSSTQLLVQTDVDPTNVKSPTSGTLWRVDLMTGVPTPTVQGLGRPRGLAYVDAQTSAVSDRVRETVGTLGTTATALTPLAGSDGSAGWVDATGTAARFDQPYGMAVMPDRSIVVADTNNNRIRRVTSAGVVTTLAGGPQFGNVDGALADARFNAPRAVATDSAGDVFVSDNGDHRIRRIGIDGTVMTVAGDGTMGFANGSGDQAEFYGQEGIAVTPDGKTVYVADGNQGDGSNYHRIRVITLP